MNPLSRIFRSSKALIVLTITAISFFALFSGKATWDQIESLIKYLVGALILGQSAEDAAKHFARPGVEAPSAPTSALAVQAGKVSDPTSEGGVTAEQATKDTAS